MSLLADLSIKRKLILASMAASGAALLLASVAFASYELWLYSQDIVRRLSTQAQLLGTSSAAALEARDARAASAALQVLASEPLIEAACVYATDGTLFASYARRGTFSFPARAQPPGHAFIRGGVDVFEAVEAGGRPIGTLYIRSDLADLTARLKRWLALGAVVLLASFAVSFALSTALQRDISRPILDLAETAHAISVRQDPTVRAVERSHDEVGVLVHAFNEMLEQIQARDAALESARDDLERRVAERTWDLEVEVTERRRAEKERKRAEDEIRALNEELERRVALRTAELEAANKELAAFSYSVSHDLRAPLQTIDGFSQALVEDCGDRLDEQGLDYLRRVRNATQRMGQIIDDMLTLSRVTRGEIRRQTVDLTTLAWSVAVQLKMREPDRPVDFVCAEGVVAHGDARLLRIVLENLLGNAWKFTRRHPSARIEFGTVERNGQRGFVVKDDGAGFDMAYAHKLFGPFQRLHGVAEFEGTGIGLATVQRIIHRHGGEVWAEGAIERGATFGFTLGADTLRETR